MTDFAPLTVELPPSFRSMTMGSGVRAAAQRAPRKIALIHGTQQRTYEELVRRMDCVTNATIRDLGLMPGSHAAIVSRNCMEYLELVTGLPEAGVAAVTVNADYTSRELGEIFADADVRVVFTDLHSEARVKAAVLPPATRVIVLGAEYERWLAKGEQPVIRPAVGEWDTWCIPYTSGTTGKPKGVMLSHRSRALVAYAAAAEFGCFSADDRFLAMTPMHHGGGLAFPMAALLLGGAVDILEKFDAMAVLQKFSHGGITGVFMVPTHFHQIFALDAQVLAAHRRPPLRAIISNAAPLPQAMKQQIVPYFGEHLLFEIYSSTEAGFVSSLRPQDQLKRHSCAGLPQSFVEVRVLDEAGQECPADQIGELFSRSLFHFNGYWNRPEETRAAFREGWLSVGDLARRDADGYIYLVDRKKDMVISGGVNIYPREIEEVLLMHPCLADVAVVGVPDEKWGEKLRIFAVLRSGQSLTIEEIMRFCGDKIAAYKIPRELRFIDSLPRNANGKVLKTHLRQMV